MARRHVILTVLLYSTISYGDGTQVGLSNSKHKEYVKGNDHLELLSWAVELSLTKYELKSVPKETLDLWVQDIVAQSGLVNSGQIGNLKGHYLLSHPHHEAHDRNQTVLSHSEDLINLRRDTLPEPWRTRGLDTRYWNSIKDGVHALLDRHPDVASYSQQVVKQRFKRSVKFSDPAFPRQWHLHNMYDKSKDINVLKVWERNITGRNITAAVVDDGLDWNNADLLSNYNPDASWDLNGKKPDPSPTITNDKNHHGTRCAGEIAAVANTVCAVGVAYNAQIAGLKVLDGPMTDSLEAEAFTKNIHKIDVYSCSWGPEDDGQTVDGPHHLAVKAIMHAVEYGRGGYGSIFVVASGNGGGKYDNCNFDGYANSIYTVTIGAVDERGAMPYYAEECASMLAVTFSSGGATTRNIVTTDWTHGTSTGCTDNHSGTSAAAPLAAGMIALMLDAQPCLSWRDVQHIIVMAAKKVDVDVAHWTQNKAGFHHSHKHGFGLMDAWRLVNTAKLWKPVPWMTLFSSEELVENIPIPAKSKPLTRTYSVTKEKLDGYSLSTLEYVHVTLTLTHSRRGDVQLQLVCPSGTQSVLAATREPDKSNSGFKDWVFASVRCWGETPQGTWKIIVTDKGDARSSRGTLVRWQLQLYGSPMSSAEVQERRKLVEKASKGDHLFDNHTAHCSPPPLRNHLVKPISERVLKIISMTAVLCFLMSLYESFEYMCCYGDEKKEHKRHLEEQARQQRELRRRGRRGEGAEGEGEEESTRLLDAEEIPLETLPPRMRVPGENGDVLMDRDTEVTDNRTQRDTYQWNNTELDTNSVGNRTYSAIDDDDLSGDYGDSDTKSSVTTSATVHRPRPMSYNGMENGAIAGAGSVKRSGTNTSVNRLDAYGAYRVNGTRHDTNSVTSLMEPGRNNVKITYGAAGGTSKHKGQHGKTQGQRGKTQGQRGKTQGHRSRGLGRQKDRDYSNASAYEPLLGNSDATSDRYRSPRRNSGSGTSDLVTSNFLRHAGVPRDLLTSLSPEELRLNMALGESSDEELLFEAGTS